MKDTNRRTEREIVADDPNREITRNRTRSVTNGVRTRQSRSRAIAAQTAVPVSDPLTWFLRGEAAEVGDPAAAEAAYRQAIALSPAYIDAVLNLGVMLCEANQWADQ